MRLTPTETDRLLVFLAGGLARRRRRKGWRLNHAEALALVCDEMHDVARGGASYEEVAALGASIPGEDDVLEGVAGLLGTIRIERVFARGPDAERPADGCQ